jgi:glycosyltransferase involved in cell wall biosynthesis
MACGTPLIVANCSGLSEVGGDGAIQVDPADPDAIVDVLARLERDSSWRSQWIERGHSRSRRFTWSQSADRTFAVIAEAAGWKEEDSSTPAPPVLARSAQERIEV